MHILNGKNGWNPHIYRLFVIQRTKAFWFLGGVVFNRKGDVFTVICNRCSTPTLTTKSILQSVLSTPPHVI